MSKNPPDRWARGFGIFGILIGFGSLALGYFNYRWQREVYAKSQEEKIFVRLSPAYLLSLPVPPNTEDSQGQLTVEVVNLGQQPMYLKSVTGEVGGHRASFYRHDPLNKEPMRRLETNEAADYTIDWSLDDMEGAGIVEVETTKTLLTKPAHLGPVSGRAFIELVKLLPRKPPLELIPLTKLRPPRHR